MEKKSFSIEYNAQTLTVTPEEDANGQKFYSVHFPDGKVIDLYTTPELDGMASGWADQTGEKNEQASILGGLIEGKL